MLIGQKRISYVFSSYGEVLVKRTKFCLPFRVRKPSFGYLNKTNFNIWRKSLQVNKATIFQAKFFCQALSVAMKVFSHQIMTHIRWEWILNNYFRKLVKISEKEQQQRKHQMKDLFFSFHLISFVFPFEFSQYIEMRLFLSPCIYLYPPASPYIVTLTSSHF